MITNLDGMVRGEIPRRSSADGLESGGYCTRDDSHETPSNVSRIGTDVLNLGAGMVSEESSELGGRNVLAVVADDSGPSETPRPSTTLRAGPSDGNGNEAGWREAQGREAVVLEFLELVARGYSQGQAARALGRSAAVFSGADSWVSRYQREGIAGLMPQRGRSGAKASFEVPAWFVPAARHFYLLTNRTCTSGSVPEAVRRTISLPVLPVGWKGSDRARFLQVLGVGEVPSCPAELRERILARQAAGKPLVPERLAREITVRQAVVRAFRNPREADLDLLNAPGFIRLRRKEGGGYEATTPGAAVQPDDGSVNFGVCVPWPYPTTACSRKWGVLVDRFQLLLMADVSSLFMGARTYIVRPRSSYRQEDALKLYSVWMREHGVPDEVQHEGGVWNGNRILDCLDLLQVKHRRLWSPHPKAAVEGRFNKLWTVLSVMTGGQIGRFRGEMEKENALLTACKSGSEDPRKHFPMLSTALGSIDQAIMEANGTEVQTEVGRWKPAEWFNEGACARPRRRLDADSEWMFRPFMREWSMRQALVGGDVPLFEDFSVPFRFAAEWMPDYVGARVRVYFDPYEADQCMGRVVLASDFAGQKAGTVLGDAQQVHGIADYARLALGYGAGPNAEGAKIRQQQASGLRRDTRAIVPGRPSAGSGHPSTGSGQPFDGAQGRQGLRVVEERDGGLTSTTVEIDSTKGKTGIPANPSTRSGLVRMPVPACRSASEDPSLAEFLDG